MNVYNFIAYDLGKNLGRAYNKNMSLLDTEDWGLFIDHDAMFVQTDWRMILESVFNKYPDYGFFTVKTNRIGQPWQIMEGVDFSNHDLVYHKKIGAALPKEPSVTDVTTASPLSGVVMISSKKTWDAIGGAKEEGMLGIDNDLHFRCRDNGIKVGLIENLYVYHWYRGDGDCGHLD
jgi:GT2 family glycosyltransferase